MTCIVVEDHPPDLRLLEQLIGKIADLKVMSTFTDAEQALTFVNEKQPELVFIDIEMPGTNGIDFTRRLSYKPALIFTTGHSQFALTAFQLDAVDFLLKPIEVDLFFKAINKARIFQKGIGINGASKDFCFVRSNGKFFRVAFKDILFVEAEKDYVMIHARTMKLPVAVNLSTITKQLPAEKFIRVHKSYMVNSENIGYIGLDEISVSGQIIPVGEKYREQLLGSLSSDHIIRR